MSVRKLDFELGNGDETTEEYLTSCTQAKRIKLDQFVECSNEVASDDENQPHLVNGNSTTEISLINEPIASDMSSIDSNFERDSSSIVSGSFYDSNSESTSINNNSLDNALISSITNNSINNDNNRVVDNCGDHIYKGILKYKTRRRKSSIRKNRKRRLKFQCVEVYYFNRQQSFCSVPSIGGAALGMEMDHFLHEQFLFDNDNVDVVEDDDGCGQLVVDTQNNVHNNSSNNNNNYIYNKPDSSSSPSSSSSDTPLWSPEKYSILQPIVAKQRRNLLKNSGTQRIELSDTRDSCDIIRSSRERCGCQCRDGNCDPETCICVLNEIRCQVDRGGFPCSCSLSSSNITNNTPTNTGSNKLNKCSNPLGRLEFNPVRVRTHFIHTMMRLQMNDRYYGCNTDSISSNVKKIKFTDSNSRSQESGDNKSIVEINNNSNNDDCDADNDDDDAELTEGDLFDISQCNSTRQGSCRDCQNDKYLQVLMNEWTRQIDEKLREAALSAVRNNPHQVHLQHHQNPAITSHHIHAHHQQHHQTHDAYNTLLYHHHHHQNQHPYQHHTNNFSSLSIGSSTLMDNYWSNTVINNSLLHNYPISSMLHNNNNYPTHKTLNPFPNPQYNHYISYDQHPSVVTTSATSYLYHASSTVPTIFYNNHNNQLHHHDKINDFLLTQKEQTSFSHSNNHSHTDDVEEEEEEEEENDGQGKEGKLNSEQFILSSSLMDDNIVSIQYQKEDDFEDVMTTKSNLHDSNHDHNEPIDCVIYQPQSNTPTVTTIISDSSSPIGNTVSTSSSINNDNSIDPIDNTINQCLVSHEPNGQLFTILQPVAQSGIVSSFYYRNESVDKNVECSKIDTLECNGGDGGGDEKGDKCSLENDDIQSQSVTAESLQHSDPNYYQHYPFVDQSELCA